MRLFDNKEDKKRVLIAPFILYSKFSYFASAGLALSSGSMTTFAMLIAAAMKKKTAARIHPGPIFKPEDPKEP